MQQSIWKLAGLVLLCSIVSFPVWAVRAPNPEDRVLPDFDSRSTLGAVGAPAAVLFQLDLLQSALGRSVVAKFHPFSGGVRFLAAGPGGLSQPSQAVPLDVALGFLSDNGALFDLRGADLSELLVNRQYRGSSEAISHLVLDQYFNGVRVHGADLRFHIALDGRIVQLSNSAVPLLGAPSGPALSAEQAVVLAAGDIRPELAIAPIPQGPPTGADQYQVFDRGPFKSDLEARLVYFPVPNGLRLAWQVTVEPVGFPQIYSVLVDSESGDVLYRRNHVNYAEGVGNVLQSNATQAIDPRLPDEHPGGSNSSGAGDPPNGCPPVNDLFNRSLNSPFRDPASVLSNTGRLQGNNGTAYRQTTGNLGATGTDISGVLHFDFAFNTADFAETHLFFETNFVHDFFYDLGFDEASGNFQEDNFGRGGLGSDGLNANARAPGRNNTNFSTPPDGSNPTMNMFLWDGAGCWLQDVDNDGVQDLDGTIDNDIVIHEYHHGVTHRLNTQFSGNEAGAMGEGGGDFFAYSVNGDTELGEYAAPPLGIRQVNSKTYGDWTCLFGIICLVHDNGEIWANVLWDMRERFRGDLVGGSDEAAINEVHQLYVNGLKLSPTSPTMLEMRDSMLQDDANRNPDAGAPGGSANYCRMWEVFAGRGMGTGAQDTKDTGSTTVVENFDVPAACQGPVDPPNGDPANLVATAVSSSQIDLTWSDNATNEDGYSIERCAGVGCANFAEIDTVAANVQNYSDNGLAASTTYRYRVRAFNAGGNSNYSNEAQATTLDAPAEPPAAPSNLTATSVTTGKGKNKVLVSVDLAWQDNSNNEDQFVIERCIETGKGRNRTCNFAELATVAANTVAYSDEAVTRGNTYRYRVKARNTGGDSGYSNEASAK